MAIVVSTLLLFTILILFLTKKIFSKKVKKRIYITCGILLLLSIIYDIGYFFLYTNNFKNSIYVVTKNTSKNTLSYYEVNDRKYERKANKFEYENNETITFQNCFESYIDRNKNKVLNKRMEECKILDSNNSEMESDETIENIINLISDLEHDIMKAKAIKVEENYYVVVALNVNLWSPYDLYKYENNKLRKLYTFDDEDIIGIKERD